MDLLFATVPLLAAVSLWLMREVTRAEASTDAERYSWMRRPSASMATNVAIRRARVSGRRASWTR
jgi:hypothetical protein